MLFEIISQPHPAPATDLDISVCVRLRSVDDAWHHFIETGNAVVRGKLPVSCVEVVAQICVQLLQTIHDRSELSMIAVKRLCLHATSDTISASQTFSLLSGKSSSSGCFVFVGWT